MNNKNNESTSDGYWTQSLRRVDRSPSLRHSYGSQIITKVVGVTFDGRQAVVAKLHMGEPILLHREPNNQYDTNAIFVERLTGEQIGYINRHLAAEIAPFFDDYSEPIQGVVQLLTGSSSRGYSLGVNISFTIPDPNTHQKGGKRCGTNRVDF